MAGVSVQAFRRQGKRFGAGLVCSEMVSACGLTYKNERTLGYLRIARDEHPLAVQVFGSDPVACADAARMCEAAGADIVDINMGCPVRKVTKTVVGRVAARGRRPRLPASRAPSPTPSRCPSRSSCAAGVRERLARARSSSGRGSSRPARRRSRCTRARPCRCTPARPTTRLTAELVSLVDVPVLRVGRHHEPRARTGRARDDGRDRGHDRTRRAGQPVAPARAARRTRRACRRTTSSPPRSCASCARSAASSAPSAPSAGCASSTAGTCEAGASARTCAPRSRPAQSVDEVERLLLEAAPGRAALIEHGDREIAALGEIEDDSFLDLPISIYAGGLSLRDRGEPARTAARGARSDDAAARRA